MTPPAQTAYAPPMEALPLGLELALPLACMPSLQRGYESRNQDEKWSIYYRAPWVEVWRPDSHGAWGFAVRFEPREDGRAHAVESFVAKWLQETLFPGDLAASRNLLAWLIDGVAGFRGESFKADCVSGTRLRKEVSFSGTVKSLDEVELVAKQLREQVLQMERDGY